MSMSLKKPNHLTLHLNLEAVHDVKQNLNANLPLEFEKSLIGKYRIVFIRTPIRLTNQSIVSIKLVSKSNSSD
jgi:hypothetical protein